MRPPLLPASSLWILIVAGLAGACGGAPAPQEPAGTPIGMSGGEAEAAGAPRVAAVAGSVELALRRADGTFIDVGELRGRRVLLVVMATFDGTSQMLLRPLADVIAAHPELAVIGVAAEPSARLLVGPYEQALSPPFPVAYDPEDRVRVGESPLGHIETIPTLVLLGEDGVERARAVGFQRVEQIEELLAGE